MDHRDSSVAARAVYSLRFIEGDDIDRLLSSVLSSDMETAMRVQAVQAANYRNHDAWLPILQDVMAPGGDSELESAIESMLNEWS